MSLCHFAIIIIMNTDVCCVKTIAISHFDTRHLLEEQHCGLSPIDIYFPFSFILKTLLEYPHNLKKNNVQFLPKATHNAYLVGMVDTLYPNQTVEL